MDSLIYIYLMLIAYKVIVLLCGAFISYLGFLLFKLEKLQGQDISASKATKVSSGESSFETATPHFSIKLQSSAPGIFFSLFGCILIVVSLAKGVSYESARPAEDESTFNVQIPAKPPG